METGEIMYEHKFDIGDFIYIVRGNQPHMQFYNCSACDGQGQFRIETVKNKMVVCPDCSGRGKVWLDSQVLFYTISSGTIGQVEINVSKADPHTPNAYRVGEVWKTVKYMTEETGIGSGSVYYEPNCFTSEEEAHEYARGQGWVTHDEARTPIAIN